jgi:hypothetical protein
MIMTYLTFENYALMAAGSGATSGFKETNSISGLIALGLYEMEKAGLIEWKNKEIYITGNLKVIPEHLSCLRPIAETIEKKRGGRDSVAVEELISEEAFSEPGKLIESITKHLVESGLFREEKTKGIFGITRTKQVPDPDALRKCRSELLSPMTDPADGSDRLAVCEALIKTDAAGKCFSDDELSAVKTSIKKAGDTDAGRIVRSTVDEVDSIIDTFEAEYILFAASFTTIFSE